MPLRKLNKILALNVFKNFKIDKNLAFKTIFDQFNLKRNLTIDDLGFLIGPIINAGGRLGFSNLGTKLLTSNNVKEVKKIALKLKNLNEKRKEIENFFLDKINFEKIKQEKKNVVIYYNSKLHEGLIGILAARLKEYFNKPSIVITRTDNFLKASARSTPNYNIGNLIKLLIDEKIIENGGGHNMAAGFIIKKENIELLDNFIQNDYQKKNKNFQLSFKYDSEISSKALNQSLYNNISKLGPFGNGNPLPAFLIKSVKIIKSTEINKKHVSVIIKPISGPSLNAICFNCYNTEIGNYLLSYKKPINIIALVRNNSWNNKNIIQLDIKDLFLPTITA
jgi:single-stranded-DNA-specific exonuclease